MRMGRPNKRRKSPSKGQRENPNRPKFSSPTLEVGRINPNVIQSMLAPLLTDMAVAGVEAHADAALAHEQRRRLDAMQDAASTAADDGASEGEGAEMEVDLDGDVVETVPHDASSYNKTASLLPRRGLFSSQSDVDEFTAILSETSSHFSAPGNTWKVHANAAKFERLLDEKYGRLRPFIESHPEVEIFVKNIQRKYAMGQFSPFRKRENMPLNKTTAVMILFMMHRQGVRFEALVLVAMFCLVGLQPWALVALVALGRWEMERRKTKRVYGMPRRLKVCEPYYSRDRNEADRGEEEERAQKLAYLTRPVGTKFNPADLSLRDEKFDALLLGSGAETLYAAALLARAGRRVCVLSPADDVSECLVMEKQTREGGKFAKIPFDARVSNVSHLSRQQKLLAPALCTSTDTQGGIRFARVGSASDGYAHSILSVPGLGTDGALGGECIPIVVNAGPKMLAEFCSSHLGDGFPGVDVDGKDDGNSTSLSYLKACRVINSGAGDHYLSKIFSGSAVSKDPSKSDNVYRQSTLRPASAFLDRSLPYNPHVRSLMAALGCANENVLPERMSMAAHVTHLSAMTGEEGMAYPVGGPRALCHALAGTVEQCGGRVLGGVNLQELLFESSQEGDEEGNGSVKKRKEKAKAKKEADDGSNGPSSDASSGGPKPRCRGVRLQNGCEVTVSSAGAVLSMLGFMPTFLHLLPPDLRASHGVPAGLPAVSERRPLMRVLVGLNGTGEELSLTGADWYRLPNASVPRDEVDSTTGQVKFGTIGSDRTVDGNSVAATGGEGDMNETMIEATEGGGGRGKRSKAGSGSSAKIPRLKFTSGSSWMKVSFPSAKDPSWHSRHGSLSTCVVTIEADDDFVKAFDTKPKVFSIPNKGPLSTPDGDMERLADRVIRDLLEAFPQLAGKIECIQIAGPVRSGLVQDPARFAISGNRPDTAYPGLYIGGSDLTVADSFSGAIVGAWLAANAAAGYSSFVDHLYLEKNITNDLERFLDEPSVAVTDEEGNIVEDLAVPFQDKSTAEKGKTGMDEVDAMADSSNTNSAESSKEE